MDDTHPNAQRLVNPEQRAQLAALVPAYEASLTAADSDAIALAIAEMSLAYPAQKVSADEMEKRLDLYAAGLSDLAPDVLARACAKAMQVCRFFPSIAEIREHAGEMSVRHFRLFRIKHLIAEHDRRWKAEQPAAPMSEADRAEYERIMKRMGAAA